MILGVRSSCSKTCVNYTSRVPNPQGETEPRSPYSSHVQRSHPKKKAPLYACPPRYSDYHRASAGASGGGYACSIVAPSPNDRRRSRYTSACSSGQVITTALPVLCASSIIPTASSLLRCSTLFRKAWTTNSME